MDWGTYSELASSLVVSSNYHNRANPGTQIQAQEIQRNCSDNRSSGGFIADVDATVFNCPERNNF
jgi:hypothetical protein